LSASDRESERERMEALAVDARTDYLKFVTFVRPRYRVNWHHRKMCLAIDAFVRGDITRLIIQTAPRHGKSELVSRCLPPYILGRNPNAAVLAASYGADLIRLMNRDAQRIIDSDRYRLVFPETCLNTSNIRTVPGSWLRNSDMFEVVEKRGFYACAGVGGPFTGKGGNFAVIDDPTKNQEEADSPTYREKLWEWYTSTLYTRLEDCPQGILLTLTRWHEDDLAGRLIARSAADSEADQWVVISFPAIKEGPPTDYDPRQEGEALWPDKFPEKRLKKIRASTTERVWSSLYQQRPAPSEGMILKREWWRFWYPRGSTPPPKEVVRKIDGSFHVCEQVELPEMLFQYMQSWDMAFKDTKGSAYVVGQVWAERDANSYLLDQMRDKMDFTVSIDAVRAMTMKWPQALGKLVEDKANGPAVMSTLQNEIPGLIPVDPKGGKESRANACSPSIKSGNAYLPHPALVPWVRGFIEECASFPNGTYADQVDSATQYLNYRYGTGASIVEQLATM